MAPQHIPTPTCPSLPPEIWIRILSHHLDLTHLWTTCRRVSSTFQAYVEQAFAETHLRSTQIDFQLEKHNLGGRTRRPEVPCTFSHFSSDAGKLRVYFTDKRGKREVSREEKGGYEKVMGRWEERVRMSKPETPHYTISLGGTVNDTGLPGLKLNAKERAIEFKWRDMLTLFFREQAWMRALRARWCVDVKNQVSNNHARFVMGEKLAPSGIPHPWPIAQLEFRKQIRRKRLKEAYQDDEEMTWAIGSLVYFERCSAYSQGNKRFTSVTNIRIPEAAFGERWFNSVYLLQGLFLDEWSCLHRIDVKREHLGL
ncbi:uncharacterized protein BDR25DRAFT_336825 [Lindgomyces ingoldianus]|uniref:Uncharacterized protein n=1 Tax=Lindgomyces ingoldianus TaxID=673940 RepID=A0ACB6QFP6_9PLEO|nr:uncharacterized protein BDR25DRAFT_336825 [Lindgomyces ingoldianus]KAF2465716.1 hypothetical protein BDR25DRAFT_336825 [Lindgomyces ingoldianus]